MFFPTLPEQVLLRCSIFQDTEIYASRCIMAKPRECPPWLLHSVSSASLSLIHSLWFTLPLAPLLLSHHRRSDLAVPHPTSSLFTLSESLCLLPTHPYLQAITFKKILKMTSFVHLVQEGKQHIFVDNIISAKSHYFCKVIFPLMLGL